MSEMWTYEQGTDGLALQCHFLIRASDKCTIRIQSHTHNLDEAEQISQEIVCAHNSFKVLRDACTNACAALAIVLMPRCDENVASDREVLSTTLKGLQAALALIKEKR